MKLFDPLANMFRVPDLRKRILFTLGLLAVYRFGGHIPTPGVDANRLTFQAEVAQANLGAPGIAAINSWLSRATHGKIARIIERGDDLGAVALVSAAYFKGFWAKGFEQLSFIPMLMITPLTFLGGAFYSIDMLPPAWRTFSLFNPIVYLISGFRWSFYGTSDVGVGLSLAMTLAFFVVCLGVVTWMFRTGYRLKN